MTLQERRRPILSVVFYQPVSVGGVAVAVRFGVVWNEGSCPFPKDSLNSQCSIGMCVSGQLMLMYQLLSRDFQ